MILRRKLILLCLLGCCQLWAQQDIQLLLDWDYKRKIDGSEQIKQVISTTGGDLVAVGEVISEGYEDMDGLFVVLDGVTGETKAWKRIGGAGDQTFNAAVQNPDGTFTLVGSSQSEGRSQVGWICQVDIDGEMLNFSKLSEKESTLDHLAIDPEGVMLATGQQVASKKVTTPLTYRIDQQLDAKMLALSGTSVGKVEGLTAADDGFVLLGNTDNRDKRHPNRIWCKKVNDQGKDIWDQMRYYGQAGVHRGYDLTATSDEGFVIAGTTNTAGAGKADMLLIKTDHNGELLWQQTYGGASDDIGVAVTELSIGGYALLGHTWSHMPIARKSNLKLVVTNERGKQMDDDFIPIRDAMGDQFGYSIAESWSARDVVIVGNDMANKPGSRKTTLLSAMTYYEAAEMAVSRADDEETFGSSVEETLALSQSIFHDANGNHILEQSERGFLELEVTNNSSRTQRNVMADVSSEADLEYWKTVYLGHLKAGQTKKLRIPVRATDKPQKGKYALDLSLSTAGHFVAISSATLPSNQPNPADLIVNKHHFTPQQKPAPLQPIKLTLELANNGGAPSDPLLAEFTLPPGVRAKASERLKIPALNPHDKHMLSLSFDYDEDFAKDHIQIEFSTNSTDKVVGIKRTFTIDLDRSLASNITETPADFAGEIFWVSHYDDEYRTVDVSRNTIDLEVRALSKKPLNKQNFAVLINGRRSQGQKLDEARLRPAKANRTGIIQHSYTNAIRLTEGLNEVQIVYFGDDGKTIVSRSSPVTFHYIPKDNPNLYVLSIGVAHNDLKYTVEDAKAFARMYAKLRDDKGRGFKKVEVIQLLSEAETTENNIKKAFINLSKDRRIKDNDLVVIFISSHGKVIDRDRYVLLPSDYDPRYESLYSIDFKEDILRQLRTVDGNKLVFIDACHSGSAGSRSFSDDAASKVMNDLIKATSGMEIFASCGDKEFSYEDESWGNGAFTKAILEAFTNEKVEIDGKKVSADIYMDKNGVKVPGSDGVITIEELKSYVQRRVPYLVKHTKNKPQNPTNQSTELLPEQTGIYMISK